MLPTIVLPKGVELPVPVKPERCVLFYSQFLWFKNGPKYMIQCGNCSECFEVLCARITRTSFHFCPHCMTANDVPRERITLH